MPCRRCCLFAESHHRHHTLESEWTCWFIGAGAGAVAHPQNWYFTRRQQSDRYQFEFQKLGFVWNQSSGCQPSCVSIDSSFFFLCSSINWSQFVFSVASTLIQRQANTKCTRTFQNWRSPAITKSTDVCWFFPFRFDSFHPSDNCTTLMRL